MTMNVETSQAEEEARKRRERLKNLRNRITGSQDANNEETSNEELPKPVFRNYTPMDDELRLNQLPKPKPESVDEEIQDQLEAAKPEPFIDDVDLTTLAPRKPDWDLKRDVAKKLEKLERRTQKAIAELIRERLKSNEDDLAGAVNSFSDIASKAVDSDED